MPKPNEKFTLAQMKDYIKQHNLNKGKNRILLGHKKPLMISKLKEAGHWEGNGAKKTTTPKKAKTSKNKEEWEKLKKMPLFKEYMRKYMKDYNDTYQEKLDYVENNIFNKGLSTVKKFMEYIPEAI